MEAAPRNYSENMEPENHYEVAAPWEGKEGGNRGGLQTAFQRVGSLAPVRGRPLDHAEELNEDGCVEVPCRGLRMILVGE